MAHIHFTPARCQVDDHHVRPLDAHCIHPKSAGAVTNGQSLLQTADSDNHSNESECMVTLVGRKESSEVWHWMTLEGWKRTCPPLKSGHKLSTKSGAIQIQTGITIYLRATEVNPKAFATKSLALIVPFRTSPHTRFFSSNTL
jgi:hypothetical protein